MKFSEIIYQRAENELRARREQANRLADIRRKEFIEKYPELIKIEEKMKNAALEVIRSVGAKKGEVDVSAIAQSNLEAQKAKRELIKNAGYPEDYLDIPYSCKECNDTGILNGKLCGCHIKLLQQLSVGELSCSPLLAQSTFENFDLKYYSDKFDAEYNTTPRTYMGGCLAMLKSYAENFSSRSESLFFTGGTGLGKTHLALSVLNRLTQNGFNVYYNSAGSISKELEKEHFGRSNENLEEEIFKNDLIIIDDLGTEFATQFSTVAINELVNNALLLGKAMIIISNLSVKELEERYGQRFVSRLNSFEIIEFVGEDIRQIKK